jgi:glycosyltransferase involved in cell wall biosynthesis
MKIGIDARKIRDFGIGTHIKNLIRYIPEFDRENEYVIFHYPEDKEYVPQTSSNIRLVSDTSPKYSIRELVVLPYKIGKLRLDLFHATHYTLPPIRPCKGVVTIHDVIHLKFPEYLPHPAAYYYAKGMMWAAAKSARKVITVSECSKQDIMRYLGVPDGKIEVVYNGIEIPPGPPLQKGGSVGEIPPDPPLQKGGSVGEIPSSSSLEKGRSDLEERLGISRKYILYLGNFLPHKNHEMLVKAYGLLKRQHKIPHCLILAGKNEKMRQKLEALIAEEKLQDDVILTGFVEPEWLSALYAQADLFVYPSLYEGFGLQALEAMGHHVPVAISNVSSLPEIAGDAAIQFDPKSAENMAEVMYKVLTDQTLRASLVKKGKQRLKHFSWQEMARKTVEIYKCVMRNA